MARCYDSTRASWHKPNRMLATRKCLMLYIVTSYMMQLKLYWRSSEPMMQVKIKNHTANFS